MSEWVGGLVGWQQWRWFNTQMNKILSKFLSDYMGEWVGGWVGKWVSVWVSEWVIECRMGEWLGVWGSYHLSLVPIYHFSVALIIPQLPISFSQLLISLIRYLYITYQLLIALIKYPAHSWVAQFIFSVYISISCIETCPISLYSFYAMPRFTFQEELFVYVMSL